MHAKIVYVHHRVSYYAVALKLLNWCQEVLAVNGLQLVSVYARNEYDIYELDVGKFSSDEMVLDILVINHGEDAHEATVTVTLPQYLAFRRSDQQV